MAFKAAPKVNRPLGQKLLKKHIKQVHKYALFLDLLFVLKQDFTFLRYVAAVIVYSFRPFAPVVSHLSRSNYSSRSKQWPVC